MLEELAELAQNRQGEIDRALAEARKEQNDSRALVMLLQALDAIREEVAAVAVDEVTVNNLDEVKAALHNELMKVSKPIIAAIEKLGISQQKIERVKADIEAKNRDAMAETHDIQVVRKPKQRMVLENIGDIAFPESLKVTNLEELGKYFEELEECIKKLYDFEIPAPQVTVTPAPVTFPDFKFPEQAALNLGPLLDALDPLKFLSDRPNKPLAVRLSDGQKFLKAIEAVITNQEKQVAAFSQGASSGDLKKYLRTNSDIAQTIGSGNKTVPTAGTRVQLASSTPCKWVNIVGKSANTDTIWVGGSNVANGTGQPIAALQSTDRIPCDNLSSIWIDSVVNGEGVTYIYGA